MRNLIAVLVMVTALVAIAPFASAQTCNVGVSWTPDPIGAPTVTEQRVYHDTDGVDGGDTLVGTVSPTVQTYQWTLASACFPSDRVYVTTVYTGGLTVVSPKVAVQSVVGAILTNSVKHQE